MLKRILMYPVMVAFCAIVFPLLPLIGLWFWTRRMIGRPSRHEILPLSSPYGDEPPPWRDRWAIPPALLMTCATVATIPQLGWGSLLAGLASGVAAGAILGAITVPEWP